MKKSNTYTLLGINNAESILKSDSFSIDEIDLMLGGRAEKENKLVNILNKNKVSYLKKYQFFQKYPEGRSQGIAVTFTGDIGNQPIPNFKDKENVCLLALDQIEDPQNFGQIIRTAECAGIDGIIFPKHHSAPITQSVLQVSQGAFINMPLFEVTNLKNEFKKLKDHDFWIIGIENSINAKPWYDVQYVGKTIIVLGSEGKGIRKMVLDSCDFQSTIPMQGEINSLNVSAAVSAILFERIRQLEAK
jgi:23S rRNA (guanosine2251-2'-O)-methyltransferase